MLKTTRTLTNLSGIKSDQSLEKRFYHYLKEKLSRDKLDLNDILDQHYLMCCVRHNSS